MGITTLGPRKMILNIIAEMQENQDDTDTAPEVTKTREQLRLCFDRLHPSLPQQGDLKSILSKGLMLSTMFSRVKDVYLRGVLRIFSRLHKKGLKSQMNPQLVLNDTEQIMAVPLVQWTQNDSHAAKDSIVVLCHAEAFAKGAYSISFNGFQHGRFESIMDAIKEFYIMFRVFGITPPTRIGMWDDVMSILVFKKKIYSTRKVVNEVCQCILESEEAGENSQAN